MKIFCTDFPRLCGRNMQSASLTERLYMRGDNAPLNSCKRVMITSWMRGLSYMPQLAVRINRAGKGFEPRFASRYYSQMAWGLSLGDPTLVQERLGAGLDPALGYAFDGSLPLGDFSEAETLVDSLPFVLETHGAVPSSESLPPLVLPDRDMIDECIAELAQLFLLKTGDLVLFPLWDFYRPVTGGEQLFIAQGDVELLNVWIE